MKIREELNKFPFTGNISVLNKQTGKKNNKSSYKQDSKDNSNEKQSNIKTYMKTKYPTKNIPVSNANNSNTVNVKSGEPIPETSKDFKNQSKSSAEKVSSKCSTKSNAKQINNEKLKYDENAKRVTFGKALNAGSSSAIPKPIKESKNKYRSKKCVSSSSDSSDSSSSSGSSDSSDTDNEV